MPTQNALTLDGLSISNDTLRELFKVEPDDWEVDLADSREFFAKFGARLPKELNDEQDRLVGRLEKALPI